MGPFYILDDHRKVVPIESLHEWADWQATHPDLRHIANTIINDCVRVSTIFLGHDVGGCFTHEPMVFETVIFGLECGRREWRCSTWEQANEQHVHACYIVIALLDE